MTQLNIPVTTALNHWFEILINANTEDCNSWEKLTYGLKGRKNGKAAILWDYYLYRTVPDVVGRTLKNDAQ